MRVAVTGATGHIGRAVVRELTAQGHQTVALVRNPVATGGERVVGDLYDPAAVDRLLSGCAALVHCACDWAAPEKTETAMADGLARAGFSGRVIVTGGVWSFGPGATLADETSPHVTMAFFAGMDAQWPRIRARGNAIQIHPGLVWSDDEAPWHPEAPGARPSPGDQIWPMVHAADLATAYAAALTRGGAGRAYLVVSEALPATSVMARFGRSGPVIRIPPDDPYGWSQTFRTARARTELGWRPERFLSGEVAA